MSGSRPAEIKVEAPAAAAPAAVAPSASAPAASAPAAEQKAEAPKGRLKRLFSWIRNNPKKFLAGVLIVAACAVAVSGPWGIAALPLLVAGIKAAAGVYSTAAAGFAAGPIAAVTHAAGAVANFAVTSVINPLAAHQVATAGFAEAAGIALGTGIVAEKVAKGVGSYVRGKIASRSDGSLATEDPSMKITPSADPKPIKPEEAKANSNFNTAGLTEKEKNIGIVAKLASNAGVNVHKDGSLSSKSAEVSTFKDMLTQYKKDNPGKSIQINLNTKYNKQVDAIVKELNKSGLDFNVNAKVGGKPYTSPELPQPEVVSVSMKKR